jgi:hypothetical protein
MPEIVHCPPLPYYVVPFRPKYLHHPILKHPPSIRATKFLTHVKNRYNHNFVCFNLYICILDRKWQTEGSGPKGSRHSLSWLCSKFLHECSFDLLRLFPNAWMLPLYTCLFVVILYRILATRHKHILSFFSITSIPLSMLATHKSLCFFFFFT